MKISINGADRRKKIEVPRSYQWSRCISGVATLVAVSCIALLASSGMAEDRRVEVEKGPIRVESYDIPGSDYRLVRGQAIFAGTLADAVALVRDESCTRVLANCKDEYFVPDGAANPTVVHRKTGGRMSRRVNVSRRSIWHLGDGRVVFDFVGADEAETNFKGKRVLCGRVRMTLAPASPDSVLVVQETVSDPQPPFGLSRIVTSRTAEAIAESFANLGKQLGKTTHAASPYPALPLLEEPLPDVGESFLECQNADD